MNLFLQFLYLPVYQEGLQRQGPNDNKTQKSQTELQRGRAQVYLSVFEGFVSGLND